MKKLTITLLLVLLLIPAIAQTDEQPGPYGLSVELIREPRFIEILDPRPEFSWIVPQEAVLQKAYQVLVSSKKDLAENKIGDIWNSGQVSSSQSSEVEYDGEDLQANRIYYWRVRLFDRENQVSEYSDIQEFRTGSFKEVGSTGNYYQLERRSPEVFVKNNDGAYFADFGKDAFAALELNYKPEKAQSLTIRLGEKLKNGRIDRNPGGNIRYQKVKLDVYPERESYQINLLPDERNTNERAIALPDSFPVLLPFRYVEISGAEDLKAEQVTQLAYFNYFDDSASFFTSSDTILNQVWELCKYSIKATTFAGYYVDGDRERIPYEADAYLNQLSHYSVDNEYAIARRTIEYFMQMPTWPTEWQLHVAFLFYQDYMYTGSSELIERFFEPLKHKTLMALVNEDGLISTSSSNHNGELMENLGFADTTERLRDIVDWPQKGGFGGVMGETDDFVFMPINTVVNSFYYQNMVIMTEFARILGKDQEAMDFQLASEKVKTSINQLLFNEKLGYYMDGLGAGHGSLHANMLPLAFDIVPEANKEDVVNFIKSRGMACSVYGSQYLMDALYMAGQADYALELMTATHDRGWYNMIKAGSTISLEAWDMKYKPNLDWNHAWGAVPANIIPRGLWGIQALEAGYGLVSIKPQMGTLEHSAIEVPTVKGKIRAEFQKKEAQLTRYTIDLPGNMTGEFRMDISQNEIVTLNGEAVNQTNEVIQLFPGKNEIEIRCDSL